MLGGGELARTLIEHSLVDVYRLFIHPLVLGTGKRPFHRTSRPLAMHLVDVAPTSTGILMLTYEAAAGLASA